MAKCEWCGRKFDSGFWNTDRFCSEKCYQEYLASGAAVQKKGGGLWHFIKKVIKWIFIIFIGLIVLGMLEAGIFE